MTPFVLSSELDLCLLDVNSGSDTRVMVKEVLNWARNNQTKDNDLFSNHLFTNLNSLY